MKLNKPNGQMNFDKYKVAAHKTLIEYYFRAKLIFITSFQSWKNTWKGHTSFFRLEYRDAFLIEHIIFIRIIISNIIVIGQLIHEKKMSSVSIRSERSRLPILLFHAKSKIEKVINLTKRKLGHELK